MIAYLSTVAGLSGGYIGSYVGGVMLEDGLDMMDAFGAVFSSLKEFNSCRQ